MRGIATGCRGLASLFAHGVRIDLASGQGGGEDEAISFVQRITRDGAASCSSIDPYSSPNFDASARLRCHAA